MRSAQKISQCPQCGELTHEFDRRSSGPFYEVTFPVIACYCPACDHIVVEAYHSREDRDVVIGTHDHDWRVTIPVPLPRPHRAFDVEHISAQAKQRSPGLEFRRQVRQEIGPILRPDDPEFELCLPKPLAFDAETARTTLDGWLHSAKAGAAPQLTETEAHVTIHLVITNKPRFKVQLARLRRRFPFPDRLTLYHFNEGRKYASQFIVA
jgi:hypothetical protein